MIQTPSTKKKAPKIVWMPILLAMLVADSCTPANAQNTPPTTNAQKSIQLDANGVIELRLLINYVAERTGIRFMFGQEVETKKVRVIAPDPIPADSLIPLLQSVLRSEGLVIADAGVEGWRRIVPMANISQFAKPLTDPAQMEKAALGEPVTRVFALKNIQPSKISELIKPLVAGGSIVPVDDQRILIVADVVQNIQRVEQLVNLLDVGKPLVNMKFVSVKHVKAAELAKQLSQLMKSRAKALGTNSLGTRTTDDKTTETGTGLEVEVETRTNQLILIGNVTDIDEAEKLLAMLDRELPTTRASIQLQYTSPQRLDEVIQGMLEGRVNRPPYQSHIEGNTIVIESTAEVLQLAQMVRQQIDTKQAPDEQSPIRFYKIRNVPAQELLQTIQSIFSGGAGQARKGLPNSQRSPKVVNPTVFNSNYALPNGYGSGYAYAGGPAMGGPLSQPLASLGMPSAAQWGQQLGMAQGAELQQLRELANSAAGTSGNGKNFTNELIGEAQVTVDIHSNTIIVVAKPEVQRIYASLIEKLDKRRPQVLVEAKIVIIDTKDDFVFGVEYSSGDRSGANKLFAFTSYGFSTVDPTNGALKITPGVGFNGTLVDPSTADVVVKALSTHKRARVLSSPRILVNDNAEGQLTSVLEVPFTSVNANQNVATTTFGGFAEAGTTINVTPTISEDNHLQMDYTVTLNTFTGTGSAGIPPPRQTNEVRSRVTVPDGYTVIVGGLTSKNDNVEYRGLPWLEKVPVIREITGHTTNNWAQTSLFVFLRPVILRDDKFKDLKYLSESELVDACLPGHYPATPSLSIP
ncbi:MAG: secretin N-terminal domain-containing protein [Pirellulales bacterium]